MAAREPARRQPRFVDLSPAAHRSDAQSPSPARWCHHHALESLLSIAPVRCATERLSCSSAAICSSPSRCRQRVSDKRANGASWRNSTSPVEGITNGVSIVLRNQFDYRLVLRWHRPRVWRDA